MAKGIIKLLSVTQMDEISEAVERVVSIPVYGKKITCSFPEVCLSQKTIQSDYSNLYEQRSCD